MNNVVYVLALKREAIMLSEISQSQKDRKSG